MKTAIFIGTAVVVEGKYLQRLTTEAQKMRLMEESRRFREAFLCSVLRREEASRRLAQLESACLGDRVDLAGVARERAECLRALRETLPDPVAQTAQLGELLIEQEKAEPAQR